MVENTLNVGSISEGFVLDLSLIHISFPPFVPTIFL